MNLPAVLVSFSGADRMQEKCLWRVDGEVLVVNSLKGGIEGYFTLGAKEGTSYYGLHV